MVSVDAILEALMSLRLDEFVDPVAELLMDMDEVPSKDLQRKLCEAGMPAGRARAVKTALTSRPPAPLPVTVSACMRIPA